MRFISTCGVYTGTELGTWGAADPLNSLGPPGITPLSPVYSGVFWSPDEGEVFGDAAGKSRKEVTVLWHWLPMR